ncbi:uncharacterized protein LOC116416081 [Nasonia vitripennis]|uniref:Uncharacterized protein n=1 Tax=Nasonia vitripennis TaxID=7425 RepID=A0A7M7Q1G7_NASVI|nr:uncharacterized protein LOC116416081 [Nasonia vitripennis]
MDQEINIEEVGKTECEVQNIRELNRKIVKKKNLILCVNIRSLNANFEKLETFVESQSTMAPLLRKLVASQARRLTEISDLRSCLLAKPPASLNKNILQARVDALKEDWDEARRTHSEIVARDDAEADAYVTEDNFGDLQGAYEEALDEFLTLLSQFEVADQSTLPGGLLNNTASDAGFTKLPKINLPSFSGNYEDWASFRDNFRNMVHDLPRISDATQLQYLKMCLTGSAAELVKEIPTTNANYTSTWKALELRYHNPRLIITRYLTVFMALPHLKKESGDELRFFIDEATRIVRALENLAMPIEQWDVWFVFLLSERLDPESRSRWESLLSEKERKKIESGAGVGQKVTESSYTPATFHEFIEFLETRAQTLGVLAHRRGENDRLLRLNRFILVRCSTRTLRSILSVLVHTR